MYWTEAGFCNQDVLLVVKFKSDYHKTHAAALSCGVYFDERLCLDSGFRPLFLTPAIKSGALDEALQAVAFAVVVFDVDQQTKAILESNILHLRVSHLGDKGI